MIIKKPMLAIGANISDLDGEYIATPKFDGIRAIRGDSVLSRSFKPIKNRYINSSLLMLPKDSDGEIVCGNFQQTSSGVMREGGTPNFTYYWFDYVTDLDMPYIERLEMMSDYSRGRNLILENIIPVNFGVHVNGVDMCKLVSGSEIEEYEEECLDGGYEGICLRRPDSPYKCGRSTLKQSYLVKIKRFVDSEAIVLGFKEGVKNENAVEKDELGYAKRSTHLENIVPQNTLGAFLVRDIYSNVEFDLPAKKGLTDSDRKKMWGDKDNLLNKIVKYSFFPKGVKDKPRHPQFLGFRDKDDF